MSQKQQIMEKLCPSCGHVWSVGCPRCTCGYQFTTNFQPGRTQLVAPTPSYLPPTQQIHPGYISSGREPRAIAGMICGLLGLLTVWALLISAPLAAVGLVLSAGGLRSRFQGLAIAGLVLSSVSLLAILALYIRNPGRWAGTDSSMLASDAKHLIQAGMSERSVENALGKPDSTQELGQGGWSSNEDIWYYRYPDGELQLDFRYGTLYEFNKW